MELGISLIERYLDSLFYGNIPVLFRFIDGCPVVTQIEPGSVAEDDVSLLFLLLSNLFYCHCMNCTKVKNCNVFR